MSDDQAKGKEGAPVNPVVIDLGKKKKKRIKDLCKGKPGPLMDQINEALEALKAQGTISPSAQTVIVVVRERRPKTGWLGA